MFHGYNPQSVVLTPRRLLPTGGCGFVVFADPLPPFAFNATQSVRCQCRNFWPNPHTTDLCGCGHHACYHSQEPTPPPTPSSPSTVLTIGAYASLMNRVSRLEKEFDAQSAKKKSEIIVHQPDPKEMMKGMDYKVSELSERMEEAEERLFGAEKQAQEIESRLNDLEVKSEELEEELEAVKESFDDEDEEEEQTQNRTKQEESHQPKLQELEASRVVEITDVPRELEFDKIKPSERKHQSENQHTTTITTIILAQPQFDKAFSLKRRSSDSNLLEPHLAKRICG